MKGTGPLFSVLTTDAGNISSYIVTDIRHLKDRGKGAFHGVNCKMEDYSESLPGLAREKYQGWRVAAKA